MKKLISKYDDVTIEFDIAENTIIAKAINTPRKPVPINSAYNSHGLTCVCDDNSITLTYPDITNTDKEIVWDRMKRLYLFLVWSFDTVPIKYSIDQLFGKYFK